MPNKIERWISTPETNQQVLQVGLLASISTIVGILQTDPLPDHCRINLMTRLGPLVDDLDKSIRTSHRKHQDPEGHIQLRGIADEFDDNPNLSEGKVTKIR
jgi:hypothetical protein